MIPDIKEVYFPKDKNGKQYATLTSATVNDADMGDKVVTATIRIDGDIVPDFSEDWVVEFKGERYIHPLRKPQASKENNDIRSSIDLTFRHWAIVELQRYFFVEMTSTTAGTAIADKWVASLSLTLPNFIIALNEVLKYWFGDRIRAELFKGDDKHPAWQASEEPTTISISYTHIWDLLTSDELYKAYGCRWQLAKDPTDANKAIIQFGFPTDEIDHIFEYGFKGGLLKIERQVQSDDIRNILLGRGGEKNVPYRYFKNIGPDNPSFPADPDWIPELANIYFDRIRDAAFRSYVQGWKYRHYFDKLENSQYVDREHTAVDWAWEKGYTDEWFNPETEELEPRFDPVEFVRDLNSIAKYGERWGALDDNDGVYPTIQGVAFDDIGRVDQAVAVGDVVTEDEGASSSSNSAEISDVWAIKSTTTNVPPGVTRIMKFPVVFYGPSSTPYLRNSVLYIPEGKTANFSLGAPQISAYTGRSSTNYGAQIVPNTAVVTFTNVNSGERTSSSGIPAGAWSAEVEIHLRNTTDQLLNITVSFPEAKIEVGVAQGYGNKYPNTFDIWVKNIWQSQKRDSETAEQYAERIWRPILGDREGNEARVVFSTGWLSISEDYEFAIIGIPIYDTSRELDGVPSEWRLTLACSKADFDTLGVLIPNERTHANAGDYFFFIGIDLPYLYYTEAEKRLTGIKQDQLRDVADINPTWVATFDKVRIGRKLYNDVEPLLSQIKVGASIRITDPRFIVEEGKAYEELYIQSVTYNYNEPTKDDPYIVPDVEIVLSDKYQTTANPIATLQGSVDALAKQVGSISNIEQIARIVGDRLYLRKDGISDLSYSPTKFNSLVTSKDFRMGGIGGAGWGIYRDINGNAVIEVDRAIVRQDFEVNNLVINQITARGGTIVESAASMEVILVIDNPDGYYCYFDQKQGSIGNLFEVDDVAYCNRWDAQNAEVKSYKRRVVSVGDDHIVLSKGDAVGDNPKNDTGVNGTGTPEDGDVIVHYGNYRNANRQFVIVRDVIGGGYERFIGELDSVNSDGTEYYFVGRQQGQEPRFFIGDAQRFMEWTRSNGLVVKGKISSQSTFDSSNTTIGETIISSTYYYQLSDSRDIAPVLPTINQSSTDVISWMGWGKDVPVSTDAQPYTWQITLIKRASGIIEFSKPICTTGKDGENAYTIDLTRDMAAIPCNANGTPISSDEISFKATVYSGTNVADGFSFYQVADGVEARPQMGSSEIFVDPTTMSGETATVTIYAYKGSITLYAVFTLYKVLPGADGKSPTIYSLETSTNVVKKSLDGTLDHTSVTLTKMANTANGGYAPTDRCYVFVRRVGVDSTFTSPYSIVGDSSPIVIPITAQMTGIIAEIRESGATGAKVYDRVTIPILTDVGDLSIGGVNLLRNTNQGTRGWTAYHSTSVYGSPDYPFVLQGDPKTNGVVWVNKTEIAPTQSGGWQHAQFIIPNGVIKPDTDYILSFGSDATKPLTAEPVRMAVSICKQGPTSSGQLFVSNTLYPGTPQQVRFRIDKGSHTDSDFEDVALQFSLRTYGMVDVWQTITIYDLMLEEGNIPTSYQPSPLDVDYLKKALQEEGSIEGGLILGSHIRLGYTSENGYRVMSGLNGIYDNTETPAFWAGGEMIDAAVYPSNPNRATSMIRMDGTGYMADNSIRFKRGEVELGDSIRLKDNVLSLIHNGYERVRITNDKVPDNLVAQAGTETAISGNTTSVNCRVYDNGAITDYDGTRAPITLSDMAINGLVGDIINITLTIRVPNAGIVQPSSYVGYTIDGIAGSSPVTWSNIGYDLIGTIPIRFKLQKTNTILRVAIDVGATVISGNYVTTTVSASFSGTRQAEGLNTTIIGNDGFISKWDDTILGVNPTMAVIKAFNYGIQIHQSGIRVMWQGTWRDLTVGTDGTLRLS